MVSVSTMSLRLRSQAHFFQSDPSELIISRTNSLLGELDFARVLARVRAYARWLFVTMVAQNMSEEVSKFKVITVNLQRGTI